MASTSSDHNDGIPGTPAERDALAALRESEQRFRLALAGTNQGLYDLNLQTGKAVVSDEYARMLGYEPGQVDFSASWWDTQIHPDDRETSERIMAECIRGDRTEYRMEYRLRTASGEWKWLLSIGKVAGRDAQGRPLRMLGTHTDITERRRAEEDLRAARSLMESIVEQTPVPLVVASCPDMIVRYCNQASLEALGITDEPDYRGWFLPDAFARASWRDFTTDGTPIPSEELPLSRALRGQTVQGMEYVIQRKDGTRRWHVASAAPVYADDGRLVAAIVAFPDITERKQAEEALRFSEERYRVASDVGRHLLFDCSVATGVVEWTGKVEELTGYGLAELNGMGSQGCEGLIHPDDREEAIRRMRESMRERTFFRIEYRFRRRDGSYMPVEARGTYVYGGDGLAVRMVGSLSDESEKLKAHEERRLLHEQLQQAMKMEAVGRLAGGVAHDFNNLLTTIVGNVDLAQAEEGLSDATARFLDEIGKAAESAAALTRQLLAFSRRQIIEPRVVSLNALVSRLETMLIRLIGEDVLLETSLAAEPGLVTVDPGQMEQVLVNLVVNARDAMPDGGRILVETGDCALDADYCRVHPDARPGRHVRLAVRDTGHGMSDEVKRHLFEPFFTTKPTGRGTGLGLATIFGTIKQAGGGVAVSSEVGRGTTVTVFLPAAARAEAAPAAEEAGGGAAPAAMQGTILLVEDEDGVRDLARAILTRLGYSVLSACGGEEAEAAARQRAEPIDLLLTDVVMPGLNGRELADRLLAVHPEMKVLYTSGYTEDRAVLRGVVEANLHFIGKPYTPRGLAAKISEILSAPLRGPSAPRAP